jgi:hypothetical protein
MVCDWNLHLYTYKGLLLNTVSSPGHLMVQRMGAMTRITKDGMRTCLDAGRKPLYLKDVRKLTWPLAATVQFTDQITSRTSSYAMVKAVFFLAKLGGDVPREEVAMVP